MKKIASTGIIACAFVFGLASCGGNQTNDSVDQAQERNEEQFSGSEMEDQKTNQSDFMTKAASSNMLEVEAGKLAQQKAQNAQVKQYAQMMVSDHTKASEEMRSAATSKNIMLPDSMSSEHQDKLQSLRDKTGAEFDRDYMDMMVSSHDETISLFEDAAENLEDPDVKSMASAKLPTLRQHREQAQQIKDALGNNSGTAQR
ncbi:DUF4142 domain-containing protein [Pontibacter sp. SGAir0037]|uniref:DUF4142 domain-containing protein n=1 Tax=Pontibacter sp. SGAir0037 TaxID=2571030 RepID=UPI0010CD18B0|nr:DUF4142 domain-containing protein [Pontibacter sp. SGAir0037]QCR25154.1 DUF305 domain-containing protein [Pontibacter sp. SGAir0037]